ncbi:hypothetical protein [Rhodoplanes roseus]|uniref:hypothetical protein n=1 Tax=Rhodoplanes roseus TaxID=29409 RepID=UPI001473B4D8|nr:hypothetical protein [Rhodoplanes roseus]
MIRASTPGTATPYAPKATLLGRAISGFGSVLSVLREAQEMRADAQRRYPFIES